MTVTATPDPSPAPPAARRKWPFIAGGAVILLAIVVFAGWFFLIRNDSPARLTLSEDDTPATAAPQGSIGGTWVTAPGSVVGYRVREVFAGVSNTTDAVGRTDKVQGSATLEENGDEVTVKTATFTADVSTLTSDRSRRDAVIKTRGLESSKFPTATFTLTQPIDVSRTGGKADAVGDLQIHGVTKRVTIPIDTKLSNGRIELVGALTFPFKDFGMDPPNVGGFVEVKDDATLEVQLFLTKQ